MPIPEKYTVDFEENGIYHVFNRTNNREKLFLSNENRYYFLRQYKKHLSFYLDTYCWCLLPNHFHLLIRIKPLREITINVRNKALNDRSQTEIKFLKGTVTLSELIEHYFKRFFQSYSLAFNKMFQRKGNLFYRPFKRTAVEKETHFTQAVIYIHANAVKHKLCDDFTAYEWSSWKSLLSDNETGLLRNELLEWFGNKTLMIKTHNDWTQYYYESDISIED